MAKKLKWEGTTFTKEASVTFPKPVKCDGCEAKVKKAEIYRSKNGKTFWCPECVMIVESEQRR